MAHTVAVTSTAITSAEPFTIGSGQAVENRKAPLLILIEALVKRICGLSQFLQGRTGVGQGCGALTQAFDRIVAGGGIAHCRPALHPHLAEITRRLLESRPVLLLVRRQRQARLERRKSGFAERAHVLRVRPPALNSVTITALLRINERGAGDRECCCSGDDGFPHGCFPFSHLTMVASTEGKDRRIKLKFG